MPSHSCPACAQALADGPSPCPHCRTPSPRAPRSRLVPWLIGLPVGAFALLLVAGSLLSASQGHAPSVARAAIKVCREEVAHAPQERKRPDLTPQDCADLEDAWRSRHGSAP